MKQMLNHCWFCPQKSQKSDICVSVEGGGALSQTQTFCFRMHSTAAAAASDAALVAVGATVAAYPPPGVQCRRDVPPPATASATTIPGNS